MARLFPASDVREPVTFISLDAVAAHLLRQRPGRRVLFKPMRATDGGPMFPVLMAFAVRPTDARAFADDWKPFADDSLGFLADGLAADPDAMNAALDRVRSAGGLAA